MNDYEKKFNQLMDGLPINDRPDTEHKQALRQHMLDKFEESLSQSPHRIQPIWRKIMKSNITKSATAAIIVLGAFIFLTQIDGTTLAWADVLEQIKEFRPYTCKQIIYYDGNEPQSRVTMHLSLSRRREERDTGQIFIFDMRACPVRTLMMDQQKKLARVSVNYEMGPAKDPDILRMLATMKESDTEILNVSNLNGVQTQAFRSVSQHNDITIWADVATGLPVKVEIIHVNRGRRIVLEDFQYDVAFDESLFSTDPPEGYQLHETTRGKPAEDVPLKAKTIESNPGVPGPELFIPHSCVQTVYRNEKKVSDVRVFYKTLSLRREEHFDDGSIHIVDITEKPVRILRLEPETQKATLKVRFDMGTAKVRDMLAILADMRIHNAEKLGLQNIDGFQAVGFQRISEFNEITIWADVTVGLPVKIEVVYPKQKQKIVYRDFDFMMDTDDSLFSTEPPEGYDVKKEIVGLKLDVKEVTKEYIRQTAARPVYTMSHVLSWTKSPFIVEATDPSDSKHKIYLSIAVGTDSRHVVIAQSVAYQNLAEQIHDGHKCLEINGFTVWNGGPEKWYSKTTLESAESFIPPGISKDRTGYAIETPENTILVVGVNGALADEELLEMIESLELSTEPK